MRPRDGALTVKVVVSRVSRASVSVDGACVGAIGPGLLLLVAAAAGDRDETAAWMADRVAGMRIFPDDRGRMDRSLLDVGGEALVISQFTLVGDVSKGRRPSFIGAEAPARANLLVDAVAAGLRRLGVAKVDQGRFGADMKIDALHDGPVTILLDRA